MIANQNLVSKILETISKLAFLERRRKITYKSIKLYPSEIHLLLFVYHIQDKNITQIADHLGLTKGAISQTLSRLHKKGIIIKETEPFQKNQLHIQFTEKGKILMDHVNQFRRFLETEFLSYLKTKTGEEKQLISDFLDTLVSIMYKKFK
ncbi:MAG: MarR family winged helix-turn-helix transcriptional regulator [Candidatus Thorarchaeota archaeon]